MQIKRRTDTLHMELNVQHLTACNKSTYKEEERAIKIIFELKFIKP